LTAQLRPLAEPLLEVRDLGVEFKAGRKRPPVRALDGVSLAVAPRETLGLVGESGSGKTTLGRAILGLAPIDRGSISFAGADITHAGYRRRRELSGELQVVFQDPYSSLNPTRTIGQTLAEMLHVRRELSRADVDTRVASILERVGLPADAAHRYPAHFSGGQRQRVAIARALIVEPRMVICDEPVSALDLSVQAQVLNLLRELQNELHLSYLFIAHDLDVVRHLSDRILVLYRGRVMEEGDADAVYARPAHPYTRTLLDAAPVPDPELQRQRRQARLARVVSDVAVAAGPGCPFAPRCAYATHVCVSHQPELEATGEGAHVACHHWRELTFDAAQAAPSAVRR
jgi:oligopeptide/dipeptide ABC transporter ATP-binding protein